MPSLHCIALTGSVAPETTRRVLAQIVLACALTTPKTGYSTPLTDPVAAAGTTEGEARVTIDGRLDEAVWQRLDGIDGMKVVSPDTLADPRYPTVTKYFYTKRGIYFGIWSGIPAANQVARLTARDSHTRSDAVSIGIDSSGNGLYGYFFTVSLGGSVSDSTILPEREFTREWDGPWYAKTSSDEDGWTAEVLLPWSILALPDADGTRTIGIYVSRRVAHLNESWSWPPLPRTQSKYLSAFHKVGVAGVDPKKEYAFYPFTATTRKRIRGETDARAGADLFWRPTTGLQVTATLNPDFGQIERDELKVNLTAFESFFPERRPFFLEGQDIFQTGRINLVNTRRIGAPNVPENLPAGAKLDRIEFAEGLDLKGALKLTGQAGRVRYGLMTAMEDDRTFSVTSGGSRVRAVAKGSDFSVIRALHERSSGSYRAIGWLSTLADHHDKSARVDALDARYRSADGVWDWAGQVIRSDDVVVGYGLLADLVYIPVRGVKHQLNVDWLDDDLDVTDFGFLRRNGTREVEYEYQVDRSDVAGYQSLTTEFKSSAQYNSDGRYVRGNLSVRRFWRFLSNHFMRLEGRYYPAHWDDRNSVGAGDFRLGDSYEVDLGFGTDQAKVWSVFAGVELQTERMGGVQHDIRTSVRYIPNDHLSVRLELDYRRYANWLVHQGDGNFTTFRAERWQPRVEANVFVSARQQLRAVMQWVGVKANQHRFYRVPASPGKLVVRAPEPGAPPDDFTISDLVLQVRYKWEIAPLSDLFVVYTRGGTKRLAHVDDDFSGLFTDTFDDAIAETFAIKLRYRIGG